MAEPKKGLAVLLGLGKPKDEEDAGSASEPPDDEDAPAETSQDEKDAYADLVQAIDDKDEDAGRIALKRFVMACSGSYEE